MTDTRDNTPAPVPVPAVCPRGRRLLKSGAHRGPCPGRRRRRPVDVTGDRRNPGVAEGCR